MTKEQQLVTLMKEAHGYKNVLVFNDPGSVMVYGDGQFAAGGPDFDALLAYYECDEEGPTVVD